MNRKEHHLPELELPTSQVREALQCLLHTILFIRAPGPVVPADVHLEDFDMTYTRISSITSANPKEKANNTTSKDTSQVSGANTRGGILGEDNDVEQKVDDVIELLLRSLTPIGPELLQGSITLSFLERRASKQLFGLVSHEEKVIFESWILRVIINSRETQQPISASINNASEMERSRIRDTAERMVKASMLHILDVAGESIDHIPPVMYEFELSCSRALDDRESIRSRVTSMPAIIKLGS